MSWTTEREVIAVTNTETPDVTEARITPTKFADTNVAATEATENTTKLEAVIMEATENQGKRGRSILNHTDDAANLRRQQLAAERARRFYTQRRMAARTQPREQQLEQAEAIVKHTFEDVEAAQTLQSLGLRIQNVVLAQDLGDAQ